MSRTDGTVHTIFNESAFPRQNQEHLSCMDSEGWQTILQQAGFGFGDEKIIRFPTSKSPSFVAVWALLQVCVLYLLLQFNSWEIVP